MQVKPVPLFAYLLLLVFAVLPLVAGIGYALLYSLGVTGTLQTGLTFQHWQKLFTDNHIIVSFAYSAWISFVSLALSVAIALHLAITHHSAFSKGLLSYLVYMPLAFPAIVAAFFFFQFLSKAGILSRIMYGLHITGSISQFPDLVNDRYGIGMIITHVFLSSPFFILFFVNLYKTERVEELRTLAGCLGANRSQTTFRVVVPLLLQKSSPTIVLYFIFMFGAYEIPLLLGRSNPELVSVLAVRKLQRFNLLDIPQGYAIAVLYSLVVFVLLLLMNKRKNAAHV